MVSSLCDGNRSYSLDPGKYDRTVPHVRCHSPVGPSSATTDRIWSNVGSAAPCEVCGKASGPSGWCLRRVVLYAKCELASTVGLGSNESSTANCVKYADAGGDSVRGGGGKVAERMLVVWRVLANADVLEEAKAGLWMNTGSRTGDRLRSNPMVVY